MNIITSNANHNNKNNNFYSSDLSKAHAVVVDGAIKNETEQQKTLYFTTSQNLSLVNKYCNKTK